MLRNKENIALSCPLWLLYRGTANQSANQWKKRRSRKASPKHCVTAFSSLYFLSNAAAAQAASATAQNSKRVLRALRYKTLWLYTLWFWLKSNAPKPRKPNFLKKFASFDAPPRLDPQLTRLVESNKPCVKKLCLDRCLDTSLLDTH